MSDLNAKLLAAHQSGDRSALITLYLEASANAPDETASGFYLTHAYVFALEAGDARVRAIEARLRKAGRI